MTPTATRPSSKVERCAADMVARWAAGEQPPAEEYFDRYPDLRQHPDAALELIAEELTLREEHAVPTSPSELAGRFPEWEQQVRALLDCQHALGRRPPAFPEPGEHLGDFRLEAELGRGSHGRVYLASQPTLAGRPVVLKVGPDHGGEHLSLARLQHTHIVPLYSVHEFPDRGLRALCLPYFGGATLAAVQDQLARIKTHRPAGRDVLDAIRSAAESPPPGGPAWGFLEKATTADAACWIGACLADALQYAHDRGLLHLDLKPSNVLLAGDGVPMLLDFHLARPPLAAGDPPPAWLGGTFGFMAPEQVAAVEAVREGKPVPAAVDARAEVYSLGVLLSAFLHETGCPPSPGLADVLDRCTETAAADRYPTAGDVAADLRRHLSDLPLKGVRNRSLAERWAKWRRRRAATLPLVLALAALVVVAGGLWAHTDRLTGRARTALRDGSAHAAAGRFAEAAEAFKAGEAFLEGVPFHPALRNDLRNARQAADRAIAADELHAFAERVRRLAAADDARPDQVRIVEQTCREVWNRQADLAGRLAGQPSQDRDDRWQADLLDVAVLAADLDVRTAPSRATAIRSAMTTLDEAENLLGPALAIDLERARYARELGLKDLADDATRRAESRPRRGGWDHLLVGRSHLAAGDARRALAEFDSAVAAQPQLLWANHYRGVCLLRLKQPTEAVAAFAACVALAPDAGWCFHNRGLAYSAAGRPNAALADFDRAVTLEPSLAGAFTGRAAIHQQAGRPADALADLQRAAAAGSSPAEVAYRSALVHLAANDRPAATHSLRESLNHEPGYRYAKELLEQLTAEK